VRKVQDIGTIPCLVFIITRGASWFNRHWSNSRKVNPVSSLDPENHGEGSEGSMRKASSTLDLVLIPYFYSCILNISSTNWKGIPTIKIIVKAIYIRMLLYVPRWFHIYSFIWPTKLSYINQWKYFIIAILIHATNAVWAATNIPCIRSDATCYSTKLSKILQLH
jgi:hypothetical protein